MIDVVAAVLVNEEGKILIARRKREKSLGGYWEFPGGKIEPGEDPKESLYRELMEEMNVEIEVGEYLETNVHNYGTFIIKLIAYFGKIKSGTMKLVDHDDVAWVSRSELKSFMFAPADLPFVEKLQGGRFR
jgi:8-oxo-dGTP diphosphatase